MLPMLIRLLALGVLLTGSIRLHALILDVPAGELLWLQGFDGNPPTPGFQVDGTLLLRSVDDIANIGVNLAAGAITNSAIGTIRVELGVSGARFINGPLINRGLFRASSGMSFNTPNSFIENTGTFEALSGARVQVLGKGIRFAQLDGLLDLNDGELEIYDGRFVFSGGEIEGEPLLIRSTAEFSAGPFKHFEPRFAGPGCLYRGLLGTNISLRVQATAGFNGETSLTLETPAELHGLIEVERFGGGGPARLITSGGWLTIASDGVLRVGATGGTTTFVGGLANEGTLHVEGTLNVNNPGSVATNRAEISLLAGATLEFTGGLRHEAGTLLLGGGTLAAGGGIVLAHPPGTLNGTLRGAVTNETTLAIRQSASSVEITGSFTATAASDLRMLLSDGGTDAPLVRTSQGFRAGGGLTVEFEAGYEPQLGERFVLINAAGIAGEFAGILLPGLPEGFFWHFQRTPSRVSLLVSDTPPPPQLQLDLSGSNPLVTLTGTPGRVATIHFSTDLTNWVEIGRAEPFGGSFTATSNFAADGQPAFHRGTIEP